VEKAHGTCRVKKLEQHVMASDAPAVIMIDRALIRELLRLCAPA
jgi:hypothetical protein